jgi:hypothetical protein
MAGEDRRLRREPEGETDGGTSGRRLNLTDRSIRGRGGGGERASRLSPRDVQSTSRVTSPRPFGDQKQNWRVRSLVSSRRRARGERASSGARGRIDQTPREEHGTGTEEREGGSTRTRRRRRESRAAWTLAAWTRRRRRDASAVARIVRARSSARALECAPVRRTEGFIHSTWKLGGGPAAPRHKKLASRPLDSSPHTSASGDRA